MAYDREIQRVEGLELADLPLTPPEALMLSLIDQTVSISYLSLAAGLPESAVLTIIERLLKLGVVTWADEPVVTSRDTDRAPRPSGVSRAVPSRAPSNSATPVTTPPNASSSSSASSSPPTDGLDIDQKKRGEINAMYSTLALRNFYELLSVPYDASANDIRKAYFELSKTYHPDTLFRKNLGAYKAKMEAIFGKITQAYEVLSNAKARQQYDQSIRSQTIMPPSGAGPSSVPARPTSQRPTVAPGSPSPHPSQTQVPRFVSSKPPQSSEPARTISNAPSVPAATASRASAPPSFSSAAPPASVSSRPSNSASAEAAVANVRLDPARAEAVRRRAADRIQRAIRSIQKK